MLAANVALVAACKQQIRGGMNSTSIANTVYNASRGASVLLMTNYQWQHANAHTTMDIYKSRARWYTEYPACSRYLEILRGCSKSEKND